MPLPFQCILYCCRKNDQSVILAAASGSIYSFNASSGIHLSTWSHTAKSSSHNGTFVNLDLASTGSEGVELERLGKRQKLSGAGDLSDSTSAEILVNNDVQNPRKPKTTREIVAVIVTLVGTSDGKHVVAVTNEDKCVRVLELQQDGTLHQISERYMPKRPCSITFTTDDSKILCADKFGDVYALPLILSPSGGTILSAQRSVFTSPHEAGHPRPFIPSATALTVHTKRNLESLKNQQNVAKKKPEKNRPEFECQLLLGHVSLLTDVVYVTIPAKNQTFAPSRSYLITSDRDEHIRISRGLPQAHIIESYCLEHNDFISKLCIPSWNSEILVSGGGDDYFLVWDWLNSRSKQRVELKALIVASDQRISATVGGVEQYNIASTKSEPIAITGIWEIQNLWLRTSDVAGHIIVACEAMPVLMIFAMTKDGTITSHEILKVKGNVIDIAVLHDRGSIVYSMDNVHLPYTKNESRSGECTPVVASCSYIASSNCWVHDVLLEEAVNGINEWATQHEGVLLELSEGRSTLSELLYSIGKLRKRAQEDE